MTHDTLAAPADRELCVHQLFVRQAERTPDAPALRFDQDEGIGEWSYAELAARSERLARRLRALGVGPDVPVAFCLRRSPQAVLAMLGILRAGGAYVPLDPDYPPDRLAFMVEDTAAPVLVTERAWLPRLPPTSARILLLDDGDEEPPPAVDLPRTFPDNLAYILYTSGSTGRPKGVSVPHAGVVRLVRETNYLDFSPDLVFLLLSALSFDVSTMEIWGPLLNGGCLAIFPPHPPASPSWRRPWSASASPPSGSPPGSSTRSSRRSAARPSAACATCWRAVTRCRRRTCGGRCATPLAAC